MMKRLLILILIVCSVLLTACTPGDSQNGSPAHSTAQHDTGAETIPSTETGTAGESATETPGHRATDSEADEPKITLPKDRF